MPKRLSKARRKSEDPAQAAFRAVEEIIAKTAAHAPQPSRKNVVKMTSQKNPAAVALGRQGGLKSGRVRKGWTPEKRSRIASHAARARWAKEKGGT